MGFGGDEKPADITPDEIATASLAPITTAETALYTKTGLACCWADGAEYQFRLRQLELMTHGITTLAVELYKDAEMINFKRLHTDVMTFQDIDNPEDKYTDSSHDWSLLSEDVTFKPMGEENRFKEFEEYMARSAGASNAKMKEDFSNFLILFRRLRDALLKLLVTKCATSGATAGGGRRRAQPVSRRRSHYYGGQRSQYDFY